MRVSLLGTPGDRVEQIICSQQMVTFGLLQGLRRAGADVRLVELTRDPTGRGCGPCDLAVVHVLMGDVSKLDLAHLRSVAYSSVVLVLEVPHPAFDWTFTFLEGEWNKATAIPLPCDLSLLPVLPKDPCRVLIDHPWPWGPGDRCDEVYAALQPLVAKGFRFAQLVRNPGRPDVPSPPPWVEAILPLPYVDYLRATSDCSTFILTHRESFGHGTVDMAARGMRLISWPGFMPASMERRLRPVVVSSGEELVAAVETPFDAVDWSTRRAACTDWEVAARRIIMSF